MEHREVKGGFSSVYRYRVLARSSLGNLVRVRILEQSLLFNFPSVFLSFSIFYLVFLPDVFGVIDPVSCDLVLVSRFMS